MVENGSVDSLADACDRTLMLELEAKLRAWRLVFVALVALVCLSFAMQDGARQGREKGVLRTGLVECREFKLVDKNGKALVLIEDAHGGQITVFNSARTCATWIRFTKDGDGVISLHNRNRKEVVELRAEDSGGALQVRSASGPAEVAAVCGKTGCSIQVRNENGVNAAEFGVGKTGGGRMIVTDHRGKGRRTFESDVK